MALTYDDLRAGKLLFRGKINENINFEGRTIFKLSSNEFFVRLDFHSLPSTGFSPEIEIYNVSGNIMLVYLRNHHYTQIEAIKVIESKTIEPFDGFQPGKIFTLENKQVWQQEGGPNSPSYSTGHVKIINDSKIIVDGWGFYPNVKLINDKHL